jgi:hypothetical protein
VEGLQVRGAQYQRGEEGRRQGAPDDSEDHEEGGSREPGQDASTALNTRGSTVRGVW